MEAEKSHCTQAGGPTKPRVSKLCNSKGLRARSTKQCRRSGEDGCLSTAEGANSPFLHFVTLVGLSKDWMMPTHNGDGPSLLSLLIWVPISSRHTRNHVLPAIRASFCPVKLTHNTNRHNVPLFSFCSWAPAIPQGLWDMLFWIFPSSGNASPDPSTTWPLCGPPPLWKVFLRKSNDLGQFSPLFLPCFLSA